MKAMKKRILVILPAILILLATVLIPTAVALESESGTPSLSIDMMNLQFNENVQILYAVNLSNIDPNAVSSKDFGMLYWLSPSDSYEIGSEDKNLPTSGSMMIGETLYWIFEYRDLAAKQMTDDIYARAFLRVGDEIYYSDVQKYSVLQYAYNKLSSNTTDANLKALLGDMLSYGASAQTYFDYKTDRLANADFYRITVEGGNLSDGTTNGLYLSGETVEFTAPEEITVTTDAGAETVNFSHWENAAEEIVAETLTHTVTVGTTDATYTAVYDTPDSYFVFTEIMSGDNAGTYSVKAASVSNMPEKVIVPKKFNGKAVTTLDELGFHGCVDMSILILPDSIVNIGWYTFGQCSNLKTAILPNFLNHLGGLTFSGCVNLTNVIIPESITDTGNSVFSGCTSLTNIVIPDNVITIGNDTFKNCTNLTDITIGKGVKEIRWDVFKGCTALENVHIKDLTAWCQIEFLSPSSNPLYYASNLCVQDVTATDILISCDVTNISNYAFYRYKSLESVIFEKSSQLTNIGECAFYNCVNLIDIVIPTNITTIERSAFYSCTNLSSAYYTGTPEEWSAITIGDYNDSLTSTTVYFYSEAEPALNADGTGYDGNYWYYDENGEPAIWTLTTTE